MSLPGSAVARKPRRWKGPLTVVLAGIAMIVLLLVFATRQPVSPVAAGWPPAVGSPLPSPGGWAPQSVTPMATMPVPGSPPAAWYPDPERPGGQRYWDGQRWTDHRA